MFPFDGYGGMCGDNFCNVFLLLFMILRVSIFAMLCKRALMMLWYAFMFLGLMRAGFISVFPSRLVVSTDSLERKLYLGHVI
jgi:hypothetical protein